jgi:PIF1-like helicase
MVHNIITHHLQAYLHGHDPPQRLMIVHGQGGTGKSALLNAISKSFSEMGASHLLAKTAMSGVAASIVHGQTLHSWAGLPVRTPRSDKWLTHPGKEKDRKRKKSMGTVLWLTIDEMSMLTTPLLTHLSQAIGFVKSGQDVIEPSVPFGGLNVVLLGDFHQLPPVANAKKELYNSSPPNDYCLTGRNLYEQFDVVVELTEQMRIRDLVWDSILQRSRTGDCTRDDIAEIRNLVLDNKKGNVPNFDIPPWNDYLLVTPRNGVRTFWNAAMLNCHCQRSGQVRYVVYADDNIEKRPLTLKERLAVANLSLEDTNHLPHKVEIAIGMKAMVLSNISTDADLANGSRGTIVDIVLDPREIVERTGSAVTHLKFPPAVILFQPLHGQDIQLHGLPRGTVPILPTHTSFRLGGKKSSLVDRNQIALVAAYAFTDFKSQGQTMECVVIDLAKPPSGALTGFNAYVALSRSRGRDTIRLLRDFEEKLFTVHPNEELRKEDVRLASLQKKTLERYRSCEFGNFAR